MSQFINKYKGKGRNSFPQSHCKIQNVTSRMFRSLETEVPANKQKTRLQIVFFYLRISNGFTAHAKM